MISIVQPFRARFLLLCGLLGLWTMTPRAQPQRGQVFRSGTELVLVNVVVRDKSGAVVRGLARDDFAVTEDDKPQTITSFDVEELDAPPLAQEASLAAPQALLAPPARPAMKPQAPVPAEPVKADMHGRRLIVLFFDLGSMQPEEIGRSVKAAHDYIDHKLSPVDLIAVVSFSTSLHVDQDFTADREALGAAVDAYGGASGQG